MKMTSSLMLIYLKHLAKSGRKSMSFFMILESVQVNMSDEEFNSLDCICYSSSSDISVDGRFVEVILSTISSVVGEMLDRMFDTSNSLTTAISSDFVTVRVSN